jgi:hypothetical protein
MPEVIIASVNGEWMNDWFTADAEAPGFKQQFSHDGEPSGDTDEAAGRLARLISALAADGVALMEAPSRAAELQLFIDRYLTDSGTARYRRDPGWLPRNRVAQGQAPAPHVVRAVYVAFSVQPPEPGDRKLVLLEEM